LTDIPDTNTNCIVDDTSINKESVAATSEKTLTPPIENEVNQESACNVGSQTPSYSYPSMNPNSQSGDFGFDFSMYSPSMFGSPINSPRYLSENQGGNTPSYSILTPISYSTTTIPQNQLNKSFVPIQRAAQKVRPSKD
jgi:hypothetical protein